MSSKFSKSKSAIEKSQIKQIIISPATLKDASIMSAIYLSAFENSPIRDIFWTHYVGLFGNSLLQRAQASQARKIKMDIVGGDIVLKAIVQFINDEGKLTESVAGFGRWTAPDGPRKRTIWEWILSTIIYPFYNFLSPLPMPPKATGRMVDELFNSQLKKTFGFSGPAHGRSYWYLHMLCIDPDWQNYGIGTALLNWSFERAAETNSVVYLESSSMGLPVYLAKGFRITSSVIREIAGIEVNTPGMIWEPTLGKT